MPDEPDLIERAAQRHAEEQERHEKRERRHHRAEDRSKYAPGQWKPQAKIDKLRERDA